MREAAFLVISLVVAASMFAATEFGPGSSGVVLLKLTPAVQGGCSESVPGQQGHLGRLVFQMPGPTAEVCVKYTNALGNNILEPAYSMVLSATRVNPVEFTSVNASTVSVLASPGQIIFSAADSSASELVTYAISAGSDASGRAFALFMDQMCAAQPIVVGPMSYDQIRSQTDWYPPGAVFSCPAITMQAQIVGVSGIEVLLVPFG